MSEVPLTDEVTAEDLARLLKHQSHQIEMLKYEAAILRAQKEALHRVLVEALQGKKPPPGPPPGWRAENDPERDPEGNELEG
jgi:hypothetical protein